MERKFSLNGSLRRHVGGGIAATADMASMADAASVDAVVTSPPSPPPADETTPTPSASSTAEEEWFTRDLAVAESSAAGPVLDSEGNKIEMPIYHGIARLIDLADRGSSGMSVRLDVMSMSATDPHPFRGIKAGTTHGQRVKLMVCTAPDASKDASQDVTPIYQGEAIVSWWSEDSRGCHVSFKLDDGPDGYDKHPFKGLSVGDEGQLLTIICWPINDQEVVVSARPKTSFNRMSAVQQSQILCNSDEEFQNFCFSKAEGLNLDADPDVNPALLAAAVVYRYCGIKSRSEFKENTEARMKWNELLSSYQGRSNRYYRGARR